MSRIYDNGVYRDMTAEEEILYNRTNDMAESSPPDALTQMIKAMSTATTVAQMRTAAKNFLAQTEVMASGN